MRDYRPRREVLDAICLATLGQSLNMVVPWLLMSGYAYHCRDCPLVSDALFDRMVGAAMQHWHTIAHWHKGLITESDLVAGSLYRLGAEDYPTITKDTAALLAREHMGVTL